MQNFTSAYFCPRIVYTQKRIEVYLEILQISTHVALFFQSQERVAGAISVAIFSSKHNEFHLGIFRAASARFADCSRLITAIAHNYDVIRESSRWNFRNVRDYSANYILPYAFRVTERYEPFHPRFTDVTHRRKIRLRELAA